MESGDSILSLSLGTAAEPSGLIWVKPRSSFWPMDGREPEATWAPYVTWENRFDVMGIDRFPVAHPLPAIVNRVSEIASDRQLNQRAIILLDISSVGPAPLRAFQSRGMYPAAIDLTNAGGESSTHAAQHVPLRDVIGAAQAVLQTARLRVASGLELAETLVSDLQAFDPKPIARNADLGGGRNADLVLALAVALWWGDRLTWDDDIQDRMTSADQRIDEPDITSGY